MLDRRQPHPEFEKHGSFEHLPLGAILRRDSRTLELANYVDEAKLPPVPATFDLTKNVPKWPMYANDRLGDCTCAAAGHMVEAWSAANDDEHTPPESTVVGMYDKTGDGTDDGRNPTDVLNYWRKHALGGGSKPIGPYATVDPHNEAHVKAAIYLFGGVYAAIDLPKTAQSQPVWDVVGNGKTGDSAPGSWGGHAVPFEAYDEQGVIPITWGATIDASWGFVKAYAFELFAIISPDWFKSGKTPAGFDLAQLEADVKALTA